ncbi:MAG: hypothetical protein H6886_09895 [Hyphomicrobiaceae bacterium]|nr:hypothetical protein [Hyphomicrobiaceae bacterium]
MELIECGDTRRSPQNKKKPPQGKPGGGSNLVGVKPTRERGERGLTRDISMKGFEKPEHSSEPVKVQPIGRS